MAWRVHLDVPFFMEIIILMAWSVWTVRNDWVFNNIDASAMQTKIFIRIHPTSPQSYTR
jgi:hypothetical protein